jgi:hypothetical protein
MSPALPDDREWVEAVNRLFLFALVGALSVVAVIAAQGAGASAMTAIDRSSLPNVSTGSCSAGSKPAVIRGNFKCLRVGQHCSAQYQNAYRKYGFHCVQGKLRKGSRVAAPPAAAPPAPPALPPAPVALAIDGHYKGLTSQSENFEFNIISGGLTLRGFKTGQINQGCTPPGHIYGNYFDEPNYTVFVNLAGAFTIDGDRTGAYVGQWPAATHLTIRGYMMGPTGSGSLELNTTFRDLSTGVAYTCGSGLQTWTVTRTG